MEVYESGIKNVHNGFAEVHRTLGDAEDLTNAALSSSLIEQVYETDEDLELLVPSPASSLSSFSAPTHPPLPTAEFQHQTTARSATNKSTNVLAAPTIPSSFMTSRATYKALPPNPQPYSQEDIDLLREILIEAESVGAPIADNSRSPSNSDSPLTLIKVLKAYETVLKRFGMEPAEDTYYYRFLLKLSLDPDNDWWRKFNEEATKNFHRRTAALFRQHSLKRLLFRFMRRSVFGALPRQHASPVTSDQYILNTGAQAINMDTSRDGSFRKQETHGFSWSSHLLPNHDYLLQPTAFQPSEQYPSPTSNMLISSLNTGHAGAALIATPTRKGQSVFDTNIVAGSTPSSPIVLRNNEGQTKGRKKSSTKSISFFDISQGSIDDESSNDNINENNNNNNNEISNPERDDASMRRARRRIGEDMSSHNSSYFEDGEELYSAEDDERQYQKFRTMAKAFRRWVRRYRQRVRRRREAEKERQQLAMADEFYNTRLKARVFRDFIIQARVSQFEARSNGVKALEHWATYKLKHAFLLWRAKYQERVQLIASIQRRFIIRTRFYYWWRKYMQKREKNEMKEIAIMHWSRTMQERFLRKWRARTIDTVADAVAQKFNNNSTKRVYLATWKAYVEYRHAKQRDQEVASTFRSQQLLARYFRCWRSALAREITYAQAAFIIQQKHKEVVARLGLRAWRAATKEIKCRRETFIMTISNIIRLGKYFQALQIALENRRDERARFEQVASTRKAMLKKHAFRLWRSQIEELMFADKARERILRTRLKAVLRAWRHQARMRLQEDIYVKLLQDARHRRELKSLFGHWRKKQFLYTKLAEKRAALDSISQKNLLLTTLQSWRDWALQRAEETANVSRVVSQHKARLLKQLFNKWRSCYQRHCAERHAIQETERQTHLHRLRLAMNIWKTRYSSTQRQAQLVSDFMHRSKVNHQRMILQAWCAHAAARKEESRLLDQALATRRRNQLAQCFQRWRREYLLARNFQVVYRRYVQNTTNPLFRMWRYWTKRRITERKLVEFFQCHHQRTTVAHVFASWRQIALRRQRGRAMLTAWQTFNAGNQQLLLRETLTAWRQHTAKRKQVEALARRAFLRSAWKRWRDYTLQRRLKKRLATQLHQWTNSVLLIRFWTRWREQSDRRKDDKKAESVYTANLQRRALVAWRKRKDHVRMEKAVAFHRYHLLKRVLTGGLQQYAQWKQHRRQQQEQADILYARGLIRSSMQRWSRYAKARAARRAKEEQLRLQTNARLARRVLTAWRVYVEAVNFVQAKLHQQREEALMVKNFCRRVEHQTKQRIFQLWKHKWSQARAADAFYQRSLAHRVLHEGLQEYARQRRVKRQLNDRVRRLYALSLLRRVFESWRRVASDSKAEREQHQAHLRRAWDKWQDTYQSRLARRHYRQALLQKCFNAMVSYASASKNLRIALSEAATNFINVMHTEFDIWHNASRMRIEKELDALHHLAYQMQRHAPTLPPQQQQQQHSNDNNDDRHREQAELHYRCRVQASKQTSSCYKVDTHQ